MPRKTISFMILWLLIGALPASAQNCRQALLLGLDVSLSVDSIDFSLQREGLARALLAPDVVDAMISGNQGHVELAVFEWSGQFDQTLLVDWTVIDTPTKLQAIAAALRDTSLDLRSGRTALGAAMLYARDLLTPQRHCANLTLDISGDGVNNNGIRPQQIRAALEIEQITVNALVIQPLASEINESELNAVQLAQYFEDKVIVGPGAFVETVMGFENYEEAIRRKLIRELTPLIAKNTPDPMRKAPALLIRRPEKPDTG